MSMGLAPTDGWLCAATSSLVALNVACLYQEHGGGPLICLEPATVVIHWANGQDAIACDKHAAIARQVLGNEIERVHTIGAHPE